MAIEQSLSPTYIALEELNFLWDEEQIFDFRCMWAQGASLVDMEEQFGRPQEEILLLALDLGMRGKIKPRQGGLLGLA